MESLEQRKISRRSMLKVMGAIAAGSALAACGAPAAPTEAPAEPAAEKLQ
jgi:hypothetical protein